MSPSWVMGRLAAGQEPELAELIHHALRTYYLQHLNDDRFGNDPVPFGLFADLYETLDPGCCLTATDAASGRLLGCLFYHPRPTHVGIGIVATLPEVGNAGVAKALVQEALQISKALGVPARLVSSALNLQSFSLYTKLGFRPEQTFQDLQLSIPQSGLEQSVAMSALYSVRPAVASDLPALENLGLQISGLQHGHDFAHFLQNPQEGWHLWVAESEGEIVAYLGGIRHPSLAMLGPGLARTAEPLAVLVHALLDAEFRGKSVVWLVPVDATLLVQQAYAWKARNVELHLASQTGEPRPKNGLVLPTFMPESGW